MRKLLYIALIFVVHPLFSQDILEPTPGMLYYQMLHCDSIFNNNFEVIQEYQKMQSTAKAMEFVGAAIAVGTLVFMDSNSVIYKPAIIGGGVIGTLGWVLDWHSISRLKKIKIPRLLPGDPT